LDIVLLFFLVASAISTALATNWWLATRALAISVSGVMLFWVARAIRGGGRERSLVNALAAAATIGAVTSLIQAYGLESSYFSLNRAPGGTFGNRNFMAHVAAIGAPVIVLCALTARTATGFSLGALAMAIVTAAQVLSRSRAAWLALIAAFGMMGLAAWMTRHRWREPHLGRRAIILVAAGGVATAAAIWLPNTLDWRSESPYLDSVRGVVNYKGGSGRGRLVQYTNSLEMATAHPLLGVGPGNWSVAYPRYASRNDPSLDTDGMTSNPWPSSDWMAYLAERGFVAFAALAFVLLVLGFTAVRQLRNARSAEQIFAALALGGSLVATLVVGTFDAVLLLAAPSLFVWTLFGALAEPTAKGRAVTRGVHQWLPAIVFTVSFLAATRSTFQAIAMGLANGTARTTRLSQASMFDPGSFRIHMRLAAAHFERGSCARALPHARAARALYPNAPPPREYLAACGERRRRRT
jgi:O-antigen ligase